MVQAAARQLQELCDTAPCCDLQLKLMAAELQGGALAAGGGLLEAREVLGAAFEEAAAAGLQVGARVGMGMVATENCVEGWGRRAWGLTTEKAEVWMAITRGAWRGGRLLHMRTRAGILMGCRVLLGMPWVCCGATTAIRDGQPAQKALCQRSVLLTRKLTSCVQMAVV
jgi:hypothetical protein